MTNKGNRLDVSNDNYYKKTHLAGGLNKEFNSMYNSNTQQKYNDDVAESWSNEDEAFNSTYDEPPAPTPPTNLHGVNDSNLGRDSAGASHNKDVMPVKTPPDAPHATNEPRLMECIKTDIIKPKSHLTMRLIMTDINTGEEAIYFVNNSEQKSGKRIKVNADSYVAKLYRLTFGFDNNHRLHEFNQLMKHFVGKRFFCTCEKRSYSKGDVYLNVTKCEPEHPVYDDEHYTKKGSIKQKPNRHLPKPKQKANNKLTEPKPANPSKHLGLSTISTNDQCQMINEVMVNDDTPLISSIKEKEEVEIKRVENKIDHNQFEASPTQSEEKPKRVKYDMDMSHYEDVLMNDEDDPFSSLNMNGCY